ncbi:D-alanyl-D-alanine carboxypeptidase family protein [Aureimonas sp. Leaf454]|uniref:D-alanyl-D-alanine carboxypeptidase family protein n=1 Tax=Aureimonas sp. Leaf454 TaxID=1736381 RepID=UPI0009EADA34|nr:D-alanyl-D-alanine carboxypeptidase family protein [Aureimonas sp. Leaf454]
MKAIRLPLRGATALLAVAFAATVVSGARAETSIVVDVATGAVLSQKDATKRWYPASTTKLMTAYVVLKAVKEGRIKLDAPVVMTRYAAAQAPSRMGFEPGSVMRLDNALRMMMVKSANDVAVAIAQTVGSHLQTGGAASAERSPAAEPVSVGGPPKAPTLDISSPEAGALAAFVDAMNADADRLGLKDTHFINPNGLPGEGQHSNARDLALLGVTIRRELPEFLPYFGTEAISAGGAVLHNGNGLLGRFSGADGMKTGYICASGFNLVGSATRNGRTLVGVVLGSDRSSVRDRHMAALLEDGFGATPGAGSMKITDMAAGGGETADISERMCSPAGRTARANAVKAEEAAIAEATAKKKPSPVDLEALPEAGGPPTIVQVGLGGAAGTERIAANISLIPSYGIPRPTFRPNQPNDAAHAAAAAAKDAPLRGSDDTRTASAANLADDLGVTKRGGIPVPTPRAAN